MVVSMGLAADVSMEYLHMYPWMIYGLIHGQTHQSIDTSVCRYQYLDIDERLDLKDGQINR